MRRSGAGVDDAKIQAVMDYLKAEFPSHEIDHLPKPDQMGDLFRVIKSNKVAHQLLIRRKCFDDNPWPNALSTVQAAGRMRKAGLEIVDLS